MPTSFTRATTCHLLLLCAFTLTHCVTSDPADQQGNDDDIRTVDDMGGAQSDAGITRDMESGTRDMGSTDQGNLPGDMSGSIDMMTGEDAAADLSTTDMSEDMFVEDMSIEDMSVEDMSPTSKCRRLPESDAARAIVAARPYKDDASAANSYEVFTLDLQGVIMPTGRTFEMGRAIDGKIHFTPDGEVGVVRQEDGTLGIFKLDANNNVTVIDPAYAGLQAKIDPNQARYFSTITMTRDGSAIIASNGSWRNVGGAVWYIPLDCNTGLPGQEVQIAESKLPREVQQLHGNDGRLVVASHDILTSMVREDAHLLDINSPITPSLLGSARVFPDDDASISAMAISEDDRYVLLGDSNLFGGPMRNNRVGVMSIGANGLTPLQILEDVRDPADIIVSPYHNAAIVSSFEGDALVMLSYDPNNATTPFVKNGEVRTTTNTLLPSTMVMVRRGMLTGSVLVAENTGIRVVEFMPSGDIIEQYNTNFGDEVSAIVGAIGVQP